MTLHPTISVIVPAYNAEPWLAATLESALAQSLTPLEILVTDDGSTDGTRGIIEAFHRRTDRVVLVRQPNCGVAQARNHAAARARGEWLAFLDADDLWPPGKLEHQLSAWDGRAPLICTDRTNIGERGDLPVRGSDAAPLHSGDVFLPLLMQGNFITTSTVLMKRELFRHLGGFTPDPAVPVCEDWELWLRVAADHPIQSQSEILCEYRLHALGTSRSPERMNRARLAVVRRVLRTPRGQALPWTTRRRILACALRTSAWDQQRHGHYPPSVRDAVLSLAVWPFSGANMRELLRILLHRY